MNLTVHCWSLPRHCLLYLVATFGRQSILFMNVRTRVLAEKAAGQTVDREHLGCNQLTFVHDWSNYFYCYNVFCA